VFTRDIITSLMTNYNKFIYNTTRRTMYDVSKFSDKYSEIYGFFFFLIQFYNNKNCEKYFFFQNVCLATLNYVRMTFL